MTSIAATVSQPVLRLRTPSERTLLGLLYALCFFSAALGRLCFLRRPFDNDAAIFIYMGQMVCHGQRLCYDLLDNKFPTVGLMTSIVYRALGLYWTGYVLLQLAMSIATALVLGRAAQRVSGPRAKAPTLLFAIVFLNFSTAVFGGFQLETAQVFFTSLAALAGIEMLLGDSVLDAFSAGLCGGCGMMFKPTAGGVLLALGVSLVLRRRRIVPELLAMAAGVAIPLTAALLYLASADLLHDMPALARQIATYAHETVFDSTELLKPVAALVLLGFPILVRGFIYRRHRAHLFMWPRTSFTLFLLLWLAIETTGVILQRRMYAYHFLPMIPPMALLFGTLPRLNRAASLSAALVPIVLLNLFQASTIIAGTQPPAPRMAVSEYLLAHAKPGDAVWMDAWPRLVLETGLRPASRLPFTFLFTNYDNAGLDYSKLIIEDFERTKPAYIVLPVPLDRRMQNQIDFIPELNRRPVRQANYIAGWHRIADYTQAHYRKEAMVGNDAVYRRCIP